MNIDDKVLTITEQSVMRIDLGVQWRLETQKRGLRNPWEHNPRRPIHTHVVLTKIAGAEVPATETVYNECSDEEISAWKAERDEYMRQRDEWIALQMFHKYGYETFIKECKAYSLTDEFRNSVRPCESRSDSQCNLFCAQYHNCALRLYEMQTQTQKGDE